MHNDKVPRLAVFQHTTCMDGVCVRDVNTVLVVKDAVRTSHAPADRKSADESEKLLLLGLSFEARSTRPSTFHLGDKTQPDRRYSVTSSIPPDPIKKVRLGPTGLGGAAKNASCLGLLAVSSSSCAEELPCVRCQPARSLVLCLPPQPFLRWRVPTVLFVRPGHCWCRRRLDIVVFPPPRQQPRHSGSFSSLQFESVRHCTWWCWCC